ncbi:MAG: AbrB/MazE/SpoVT family DNA-binding domain-containing protein [Candidatus Thorarchaeota archaeon]|jgi:phosphate uptake regulator
MENNGEYRKIQRVGRGSYIITLPKEWVKDLGLKKGNHVALRVQDDSSLLVIPRKVLEERKEVQEPPLKEYRILVDPNLDSESVCRKVTSLYVISADLIHIRFKEGKIPPEYKAAISHFSKNLLLGSEIISETSNEMTLQILISHPDFPVGKAIRRMSILALSANKDAVSMLENRDGGLARAVAETCSDIDRLNLYVIRQLKYGLERNLYEELGLKNPKEFLGYRIVANVIKGVSENALNMAKDIATLKKMVKDQLLLLNESVDEEIHSQLLEFNSKTHVFFEGAMKALFKRDYDRSDKLISQMKSLTESENELITMISAKKMDPNISSVFRLILDSSRRLVEYGRNIAEVALNRTVEENSQLI